MHALLIWYLILDKVRLNSYLDILHKKDFNHVISQIQSFFINFILFPWFNKLKFWIKLELCWVINGLVSAKRELIAHDLNENRLGLGAYLFPVPD